MRILLVEDDRTQRGFVVKALKEDGHVCEAVSEGREALQWIEGEEFDLVILDLGLPDVDGLELLRTLRRKDDRTPVLILSARGLVEDKVVGLNEGADDYMAKPFSIDELRARMAALLRRSAGTHAPVLEVADLKLDLLKRRASRGEREIELTMREFALLEFFMRNAGRALSRTTIAEHVWDYNFDWGSNVVDVFVNHLRRKIERPDAPRLIHTVRAVGYRFGPESRP
jgi:DNA-binding response OmpR family regulator